MFRIRRILDDTTEANRDALGQVQRMLREQFAAVDEADIAKLPEQLRNPLKFRYRAVVFVAEDSRGKVTGFAMMLHVPDLNFCYLDWISAAPGATGGGIGGALFERVRQEALALGADGLFLECLPDDPALSPDPATRAQNAARLRFYERYGVRPLAGTGYETPLQPGGTDPPYLLYDDLGRDRPLGRERARTVVNAILDRKYGPVCPRAYVRAVLDSIVDDPVRLREPRSRQRSRATAALPVRERRIALVVNLAHSIHHVRERGYVESPVRIDVITRELHATGLFDKTQARHFSESHIRAVHDGGFVDYLRKACAQIPANRSVYPYVFPLRNQARPPRQLPLRAGYYCIDTFTPLNGNAYKAAVGAVDCALTAAGTLLDGHGLAYALVRPPGHHAERQAFGGFCYFNSAAVAAHYLSRYGRVAVLDVDYHHGNGTQDIFYQRADVLTVSIHGHPRDTYPYFSGFEDERGEGPGAGYNVNLPLHEGVNGEHYRAALARALRRIERFRPHFMVLSLGLDTARGDPTGSFTLSARDFRANGEMIGALRLPVLVVQEGGYRTRSLGINARHFFEGLWAAHR